MVYQYLFDGIIMCKEWEIRGNPVMAVDSCENLVASGNLLHSHGIDGHSK